jgi:hypothetical protein
MFREGQAVLFGDAPERGVVDRIVGGCAIVMHVTDLAAGEIEWLVVPLAELRPYSESRCFGCGGAILRSEADKIAEDVAASVEMGGARARHADLAARAVLRGMLGDRPRDGETQGAHVSGWTRRPITRF